MIRYADDLHAFFTDIVPEIDLVYAENSRCLDPRIQASQIVSQKDKPCTTEILWLRYDEVETRDRKQEPEDGQSYGVLGEYGEGQYCYSRTEAKRTLIN